jgi:hypothetical protein
MLHRQIFDAGMKPGNNQGGADGRLLPLAAPPTKDENGTEIFRIDRFRFLYYEPFLTRKIVSFNWFHNHFQSFFVLFNC